MNEQDIISEISKLKAALGARDRAEINAILVRLINGRVRLGERWIGMAQILLKNGEFVTANKAMELLVEQTHGSSQAKFEQSAMLAQTGRLADAENVLSSCRENIPSVAGYAYLRGTISINSGQFEKGKEYLQLAVDNTPALGQAWLALASMGKVTEETDFLEKMRAAEVHVSSAPALDRANYWYARGKAAHDLSHSEKAFSYFEKGAALKLAESGYSRDADSRNAEDSVRGFSADSITRFANSITKDTSQPIFVVGLPRSGTTLLEQILSRHSSVGDGGELGKFRVIDTDFQPVNGYGPILDGEISKASRISDLYLHLVRQNFPDQENRIVDKSLDNSRYVGLIASVLPDAPIVWIRRDPVDCAYSIFSTYFARGLDWSWSFEDIVRHFQIENWLFDFWTKMLGTRIHVVDYATLVSSPEREISKLAAHCGLDYQESMLSPHENTGIVTTASVAQVRQPISKSAIGSADPYRPLLAKYIPDFQALSDCKL